MKKGIIGSAFVSAIIVLAFGFESSYGQDPLQVVTEGAHRLGPNSDFHAGIHSGSWTLKREQILDAESKDKYRSCRDPYCNRCSKHLADYGHEYQFIDGPNQRQPWYRGTAGSIAHVTQRCYDEHGIPYARRCRPGAVMSWEYKKHLNHAICEQIRARNAVAAEEAAEERVMMLQELHAVALGLLEKSEGYWNWMQESGHCASVGGKSTPCCAVGTQSTAKGKAIHSGKTAAGLCEFCAAKAQYEKDRNYVASVERELAGATREWQELTAIANEAVRIALLSKDDADKATRFKRIQHKPPKYKEVLAAREAAEEAAKGPTKVEPKTDPAKAEPTKAAPEGKTTSRVALPRG